MTRRGKIGYDVEAEAHVDDAAREIENKLGGAIEEVAEKAGKLGEGLSEGIDTGIEESEASLDEMATGLGGQAWTEKFKGVGGVWGATMGSAAVGAFMAALSDIDTAIQEREQRIARLRGAIHSYSPAAQDTRADLAGGGFTEEETTGGIGGAMQAETTLGVPFSTVSAELFASIERGGGDSYTTITAAKKAGVAGGQVEPWIQTTAALTKDRAYGYDRIFDAVWDLSEEARGIYSGVALSGFAGLLLDEGLEISEGEEFLIRAAENAFAAGKPFSTFIAEEQKKIAKMSSTGARDYAEDFYGSGANVLLGTLEADLSTAGIIGYVNRRITPGTPTVEGAQAPTPRQALEGQEAELAGHGGLDWVASKASGIWAWSAGGLAPGAVATPATREGETLPYSGVAIVDEPIILPEEIEYHEQLALNARAEQARALAQGGAAAAARGSTGRRPPPEPTPPQRTWQTLLAAYYAGDMGRVGSPEARRILITEGGKIGVKPTVLEDFYTPVEAPEPEPAAEPEPEPVQPVIPEGFEQGTATPSGVFRGWGAPVFAGGRTTHQMRHGDEDDQRPQKVKVEGDDQGRESKDPLTRMAWYMNEAYEEGQAAGNAAEAAVAVAASAPTTALGGVGRGLVGTGPY